MKSTSGALGNRCVEAWESELASRSESESNSAPLPIHDRGQPAGCGEACHSPDSNELWHRGGDPGCVRTARKYGEVEEPGRSLCVDRRKSDQQKPRMHKWFLAHWEVG